MKQKVWGWMLAGVCITGLGSAHAKEIFTSEIQVGDQAAKILTYNNISNVADQYDTAQMLKMFPNYSDTTQVAAKLDLRGVDVKLDFAENSGKLNFTIPSLGIVRSYGEVNGSREDAKDAFLDALKGEDKDLLKALTKEWVKHSPIDPVAGNPTSLLSTMVVSSTDSFSDMTSNQTLGIKSTSGSIGIMPRFGRYTQAGYGVDVYNLPLNYAHWFDSKDMGIAVDMPLTLVDTEGSLTGSVNLGIGLNFKVTSNHAFSWYLMPQIRGGVTASEDFGTAALIYGGGLGSNLQFPLNERSSVGIINMVSYYKTDPIKIKDFNSGYDLQNTVYRNGAEYSRVLSRSVNNSPLVAKFQFARTDYHGDELFSEVSHDISASLGFKNQKKKEWVDEYRAGVTYTHADKGLKGFLLNLGYVF